MRQRRGMHAIRAVLLVLLALGVCGMHTLGHIDGRHGGGHATEMASPPLAVVADGLQAVTPQPAMPGFDPTDVCLAILASLVVLLLSAAWTRAGRSSHTQGGMLSPTRQVARPPPKLTSQRLATLSTLRI